MSRVIKFRTWHPASGRLYYEWMPEQRSFFGHEAPDGGASLFHYVYGDNVHPFKLGPCVSSHSIEAVVWEQFIGLKDKNSREIYEGDIVRVQGWAMTCTIVYHFGGFACAYSWTNKDKVETAHINMAYFAGAYLDHLEVIGNVHENPELLT